MGIKSLAGQLDRHHLTECYPALEEHALQELIHDLERFLEPQQIIVDYDQRIAFSYDATGERYVPDLVVFAKTDNDVEQVMRACDKHHIYVIPRGSSSNLSGGTTPILGGVVLTLTAQRGILEIDTVSREVRMKPGVVNWDLQQVLKPLGFFYPPDPASHKIATLGGNVAENSGGPHCVKYGVTTNHVVQLQVVLADGTKLWTPKARDYRTDLDFTGILVGSEGTMAIFTEIVAAIWPQPETIKTMLGVFSSVEQALDTVSALIAQQIVPATLELLDKKSLQLVESFVHAGYPVEAGAVLLIEVDGPSNDVLEKVASIQEIVQQQGATDFRIATTDLEADALWRGRRSHYGAAARLAPHLWIQDVTVPRPLLAAMMQDVLEIGHRYGFDIFCSAHAGDGNLHPIITYNPANPEELQRLKETDRAILQACVARGGAITGEHGVGIDKLENMDLMYGPKERQIMAQIKRAFDPKELLNPLKVVLAPKTVTGDRPELTEAIPRSSIWTPGSAEDLQDAIRTAIGKHFRVSIGGGFQRWPVVGGAPDTHIEMTALNQLVDFDRDNLTLEVEAGFAAAKLLALLHQQGLDVPLLPYTGEDTVGGLIASNARNWRNSFLFGWRDVVLGVEWVDGRGDVLRFGRKTMKNVAGYDVTKLAIGSWGTLGAISKVILRLRPYPKHRLFGYVSHSDAQTLLKMSLDLSGHYNRPEGMVLTHWRDEDPSLWLSHQASGFHATESLVESLCKKLGVHVTWVDEELWKQWEQKRQELIHWALNHGIYGEGGLKVSRLESLVQGLEGNHDVLSWIVYPGSGAFEIYGKSSFRSDVLGLQRVVGSDRYWEKPVEAAWQAIRKRLEQVFDPYEVFSKIHE
ncbi:FAD-binding oxidoreductase [Sulfobacillus thermosulfidooxidans]|uniref:FAD-binding oxidoreductase n=1 Tax=Sulfobacillus thermosulfidooxidans TaxID=28034 RepID=UPI000407BBD4|nr:FAD-binding oxidoreductase [Sulfobacillus thermosulfidooxidans]